MLLTASYIQSSLTVLKRIPPLCCFMYLVLTAFHMKNMLSFLLDVKVTYYAELLTDCRLNLTIRFYMTLNG